MQPTLSRPLPTDRSLPLSEKALALVRRLWFPSALFLIPFASLAIGWDYPTYYDHYAITTKHLAEDGTYSLDGVRPFTGQQPPGFSILSVPFHFLVGFPHAVKLSGAFWTGLAAVCLYLLLGETSLKDHGRPLSLFFLFNPETISVAAQWGFSESALAFTLTLGALLLVLHHRHERILTYLLAGVVIGYAPLIRFPGVAFVLCYLGYSALHARRLRAWALAGLVAVTLPLGFWMTRPRPPPLPAEDSPWVRPAGDAEGLAGSTADAGEGLPSGAGPGGETALPRGVPSSLEKYFRAISYFRAPEGERLGLLARVVALCLVTEAARIYLLLLPFVYLGAVIAFRSRVDPLDRPIRWIVAAWLIYLAIHIAYGNMIPRYLLPILPLAVVLAGLGAAPFLRRRGGRAALVAVLAIHVAVSIPFAWGPADDAWSSVLGVEVTRRAKNLEARSEVVRWVNEHLPQGAILLDPKHGNEAAYRPDLLVVLEFDLALVPPPAYMVDYGEEYIYVRQRLDRVALADGEIASAQWVYYRDDIGGLITRRRDAHHVREIERYPDLEGEVLYRTRANEIQLVELH